MGTVFPLERWGEQVNQMSSSYQMMSFLQVASQTVLYVWMANFSVERKYNIKNIKTILFIWSKFNLIGHYCNFANHVYIMQMNK